MHQALRVLNQRLRRLLHQSISDLIDPSRVYTSTLLLRTFTANDAKTSATMAAGKKARDLMNSSSLTQGNRGGTNNLGGKGKYYRTSAAVNALFGDTHSYQARQFLQRGGALYAPLPGSVQPFTTRLRQEQNVEMKERERMKAITQAALQALESAEVDGGEPINLRASSVYGTGSNVRPISRQQSAATSFEDRKSRSPPSRMNSGSGTRSLSRSPTQPTSTSLSRINSAASPLRSRGSSRNMVRSSSSPGGRPDKSPDEVYGSAPLDFNRLFEYQPRASYRPAKLFDPQLIMGKKTEYEDEDEDKSVKPWESRDGIEEFIATGNKRMSTDRMDEDRFRPSQLASLSMEESSYGGDNSFVSSTGSNDQLSLVHNQVAAVPISFRAKAALMNLMVEKTSRQYKNEIQTNQTALRIALLKGKPI